MGCGKAIFFFKVENFKLIKFPLGTNLSIFSQVNGCNVLLVTPAQSLAFPSAEYVREVIVADCNEHRDESQQSAVVIDGVNLFNIDSTVAKVKFNLTFIFSCPPAFHLSTHSFKHILHGLMLFFFSQVIKLLSEDLKVLEVPILLWRWPLPVTQTLLGIDPKMKPLFRNAATLDLVLCKFLDYSFRH